MLVLNRDKTRVPLLLPLNYKGSPGSSLPIVCLFFLKASLENTRKEGYILPYPVIVGYNCPSIM